MNPIKWIKTKLTPRPVEPYRPSFADVEQIGADAIAEALNVSPTLERLDMSEALANASGLNGEPVYDPRGDGSHGGAVYTGFRSAGGGGPGGPAFGETVTINNGPTRTVPPPANVLERHAAIATEAIDKFAADEQRLLEQIAAEESGHAARMADLRQQLADTRTALRFYRTGPDMLKRRPERAAPAKKAAKTRARRKPKLPPGVNAGKAPETPKAPRKARKPFVPTGLEPIDVPAVVKAS